MKLGGKRGDMLSAGRCCLNSKAEMGIKSAKDFTFLKLVGPMETLLCWLMKMSEEKTVI